MVPYHACQSVVWNEGLSGDGSAGGPQEDFASRARYDLTNYGMALASNSPNHFSHYPGNKNETRCPTGWIRIRSRTVWEKSLGLQYVVLPSVPRGTCNKQELKLLTSATV